MESLVLFNIQRFSTHDGSGVRTNLFFKGCPLKCKWCSNPESQSSSPELVYDKRRCKNLRQCVNNQNKAISFNEEGIRIERKAIRNMDDYRSLCPAMALTVTGEGMDIDLILDEIKKDLPFYSNDEGGVTFTGGEPFSQDDFLFKLAGEIKKMKINLAVETCLHVPWEKISGHLHLFDTFLVDIKHTDPAKFRTFTGGNLKLVNQNLFKLIQSGARVVARLPVIPGFNFTEVEMKSIINFISSLEKINEINFIPYHLLGKRKYELLNRQYEYGDTRMINREDLEPYCRYAIENGFNVNIGG